MHDQRLNWAREFLREAVYRSRARQAAGGAVASVDLDAARGPGNCGLGEKAAVDLDLSERGAELFAQLWPEGLEEAAAATVQTTLASWVRRNDALDRKRNHFLKEFRQLHGFDRRTWSPELLALYETGLEDVNEVVDSGLDDAAEALTAVDPGLARGRGHEAD
ncbi:MAG: hypothetical protein WD226_05200 [Planctomycetota bacterium]